MKQICDGYNPKVLMGNWYQQSYSVPQPARDNPIKIARTKEVDIGFIDNKGKLRQLNRVSRLQPWNTNDLVSTLQNVEGKTNNKTIMKQNYDLKITNNFHCQWKPQPFAKGINCNKNNKSYVQLDKFKRNHTLFNEHNINQLLNERTSDQSSFKSQIKTNYHPSQNELFQTVYQLQMSKPAEFYSTTNNLNHNTMTSTNDKNNGDKLNKSQQAKNFRRIRSEITLKNTTNFPLTYK